MLAREIHVRGHHIGKSPHRLDLGLHAHQHSAHVGVMDDGDSLPGLVSHRSTLDPLLGIVARLLIGALGDAQALNAHLLASLVHHREHVCESLVLATDQETDGTLLVAEAHHAGGTRVDTQFMFDGDAAYVVAFAQAAIGVDQYLGHQEQRDSPDTLGRIGSARQDQVHYVFGHIVIAPGDEDLLTVEPIVIPSWYGAGTHGRQVGTGLRLGP